MFAINPYNFNTLFDSLGSLQQQYQQESRPKIVKKVETEDAYQIQIFKKLGDFNSYEVRVVRGPQWGGYNLVNVVIESVEDNFKKVFQFSLDDIEVSNIDWEYYPDSHVLVLNVPKKVQYCDDFSNVLFSIFGEPQDHKRHKHNRRTTDERKQCQLQKEAEAERAQALAEAEQAKARAEAEKKAREAAKRAEAERKAKEAAKRAEAERRAKVEAERKARELARRARDEADRRAREEAEIAARAQRVKHERARREALLRQKKEQEAQQADAERARQMQQEFVQKLLGGMFGQQWRFVPQNEEARGNEAPAPQPAVSTAQHQEPEPHDEEMSDAASINLDVASTPEESPITSPAASPKPLHKQPSLEEVEDEEFVMFRKKVGEK